MSEFNDYSAEFAAYEKDYPMREIRLTKGTFRYILAGPSRKSDRELPTLVFLNGGMNSYEMWLRYVKDLSADYQVLSFDFPEMYDTNQALLEGIHELLGKLSITRVILLGASMGGIIAQLYARKYPADVAGLCLMSTAGLTAGAMKKFKPALNLMGILIGIMKILPYSWIRKSERKSCGDYVAEAEEDARAYFNEMFDHIYENYTKGKDLHVARLMRDFKNQKICDEKDFAFLAGKVLLLLPEDDSAFPPALQQELVEEMTDPVSVPGIKGGHLTTEIYYKDYIRHIRQFLSVFSSQKSTA